jgi:sialic acid synthase SpsE/mannose-6-phosphate isomerase-like protein (cupin superfamily)
MPGSNEMKNYFDRPLFIFEMANNHMGNVKHGLSMIKAFAEASKGFPFQFGFKFQFRHFDTFIHPDYQSRMDLKYIKRFSETKLTKGEFQRLKDTADAHGFISICTPFDEPSVDLVEEMGFSIIKIASCSFTDWPLLEHIVKTDKPIIASTAGANLDEIDRVVSFLQHRDKRFAIMHCVGEYPTKIDAIQMNQIDLLKQRYPDVTIGYSTHEEPDNAESIQMAIAKGASIFEKHVAIETEVYKKNDYSATLEQVGRWLQAAHRAYVMNGVSDQRSKASDKELADLRQFKRGVFAKRRITRGETIDTSNTFLAFPNSPNQLLANDLSKYIEYFADRDIDEYGPVGTEDIKKVDRREKVYAIVQRVKQMLAQGSVVVPGMATLELSHHYGLDRFEEFGCTIINVINREYCKKYLILFPGQKHPEQYHKIKEETFVVLYGDVQLTLDDVVKNCTRGDIVTVSRGTRHPFNSVNGTIIEEISSTHLTDDSYYTDETILKNKNRKTVLSYWLE